MTEAAGLPDFLERWREWKAGREPGWRWVRRLRPSPPLEGALLMRVQTRQGAMARGVGLSPDGRRAYSASREGYFSVWDAVTGRLLAGSDCAADSYWSLALSPDGRRAATGGGDSGVSLWDAGTGERIARWACQTGTVFGVAFSPDGRRLASAAGDTTVCLWDVPAGREAGRLRGHARDVIGLAFSPCGGRLASGCAGGTVKVWDLRTAAELASFQGGTSLVDGLAFSPDGRLLASASDDGVLRLWDLDRQRLARDLRGHAGWVLAVAFFPDGRLASGGEDGTVRLWGADGQPLTLLHGHEGPVRGLTLSPDASRLASAADDGTVGVWDLREAPAAAARRAAAHDRRVRSLAASEGGDHVASCSGDERVCVWRWGDGGLWFRLAGSDDARYRVELTGSKERLGTTGHNPVRVTESPDGKHLASMHPGGKVRLWRAGTLKRLARLGSGGERKSVVFSPDGTLLAGRTAADYAVTVWEVPTGEVRYALELEGCPEAIGFSEDGRCLGCWVDRELHVWDATTGAPVARLRFPDPRDGGGGAPQAPAAWFSRVEQGETVFASSSTGEVLARYPVPFPPLIQAPSAPLWAGSLDGEVHLLRLEGAPPAPAVTAGPALWRTILTSF